MGYQSHMAHVASGLPSCAISRVTTNQQTSSNQRSPAATTQHLWPLYAQLHSVTIKLMRQPPMSEIAAQIPIRVQTPCLRTSATMRPRAFAPSPPIPSTSSTPHIQSIRRRASQLRVPRRRPPSVRMSSDATATAAPGVVPAASEEHQLYFCYGSNMSREKMRTRGDKTTPPIGFTDVWIARVPDCQLCFDIRGAPPFEPAMASVRPAPGDEVYGLVYRLDSQRSWKKLLQSEGVTKGLQDPNNGYHVVEVDAECFRPGYESEKVVRRVQTLMTNPKMKIALSMQPNIHPSRRYMNLLVQGAKQEQLPEKYVERLESIAVARKWPKSMLTWMMFVVIPLLFRTRAVGLGFMLVPFNTVNYHLFVAHENRFHAKPSVLNSLVLFACKIGLFLNYGSILLPALLLLLVNKRSRRSYVIFRDLLEDKKGVSTGEKKAA